MTDNFPQICSESGLTCETCTSETARQVAAVCKGLRGKAIGHLFVQIYTNAACAPMHKRFVAHYQAASEALSAIAPAIAAEPIPARRGAMFAGSRVSVAAAA